MPSVTFLAAISPTASAIKIDGQGGGARIQLDVSEEYMSEVVTLTALRETLLRVTMEVEQDER